MGNETEPGTCYVVHVKDRWTSLLDDDTTLHMVMDEIHAFISNSTTTHPEVTEEKDLLEYHRDNDDFRVCDKHDVRRVEFTPAILTTNKTPSPPSDTYFLKLFFGCIVFCFVSVTFLHYVYVNKTPKEKGKTTEDETVAANTVWNITDSPDEHEIPVLMSFVNADNSNSLQMKFKTCMFSMVKLSSAPIVLYVAGDKISQGIAESIVAPLDKKKVRLVTLDVDALGREMEGLLHTMQHHFSYKGGSYYSHALFFLSIAMHKLAPPTLRRLIMLDADLQFKADIKHLFDLFEKFEPSNLVGIGYEFSPVYRNVLWKYRNEHPGTRLGGPKPDGLPGFNSGVLLLDLEKMRASALYNSLLDAVVMKEMSEKYFFQGHLGDQDFYTLVSFEHEDMFYVLPCTWNRQLCQWWRDKGIQDVFDDYFSCDGPINIYHGNCNAPFPSD
ncbi:hypothetical protein BaRGS_00011984 [Batillaria attramentaria]|uniref:Xyloside xylosyltransferase 1 n=1 Tax=Batillaria attramentaria TaxID=370345 RepID=A0ABD0LBP4_9CAEN